VVYGCYRLFEIWKKKTDSKEEKIV
jgi:hypothetical protein